MSNVEIIKSKGEETIIKIGDKKISLNEIADQLGYSISCYRKRVSKFQTGNISQEELFSHNPRDGDAIEKIVHDFFEANKDEEFALFDLASRLGLNHKTVGGIANRLYNHGKIRKRRDGIFKLYRWKETTDEKAANMAFKSVGHYFFCKR